MATTTLETEALGTLLTRYPRRLISSKIQESPDIETLIKALRPYPNKEDARAWSGKDRTDLAIINKQTSTDCLVGFFDPAYPDLLRAIPDPPIILHVRGDTGCLALPAIAIVGSRKCTSTGKELAQRFAQELGAAGLVVTSGLAFGIDAHAHKGALAARGRTIACLGSGLDEIYPRSHSALSQHILSAGGLIVSEYAPRTSARPFHFPERNRIISGLSLGVLIVEASERSGSLITARLALEQGRDVFALPGPVDSFVSSGTHRMIRDGAELVVSSEQVLESLGMRPLRSNQVPNSTQTELTDKHQYIIAQTSGYVRSVDELQQLSGCSQSQLMTLLGELELFGIVRQTPEGYIASSLHRSTE